MRLVLVHVLVRFLGVISNIGAPQKRSPRGNVQFDVVFQEQRTGDKPPACYPHSSSSRGTARINGGLNRLRIDSNAVAPSPKRSDEIAGLLRGRQGHHSGAKVQTETDYRRPLQIFKHSVGPLLRIVLIGASMALFCTPLDVRRTHDLEVDGCQYNRQAISAPALTRTR